MTRRKRIAILLCLAATYSLCFGEEHRQGTTPHPYWPPLRNDAPVGKGIVLSEAETKMLQPGDVIFRLGYGYWSFISEQYDGRWSHVGVLDVTEEGVFVIHSHGADETHAFSGVQQEPLSRYLRESREIRVMRVATGAEEGRRIAIRAASLIGNPFDTDFALDNDKYYCSEVVLFSKPELFSQFTQKLRPRRVTSVAHLSARSWPDSIEVITNSGIEQAINKADGTVVVEKKIVP